MMTPSHPRLASTPQKSFLSKLASGEESVLPPMLQASSASSKRCPATHGLLLGLRHRSMPAVFLEVSPMRQTMCDQFAE